MGPEKMKADTARFEVLLAASGLTDEELYDALKIAEQIGARNFVDRVRFIRRSLRQPSAFGLADNLPAFLSRTKVDQAVRPLLDEVNRLLLVEAHLSASAAAKLLVGALARSRVGRTQNFPPFRPKEGLRKWIARLPVSDSELLNQAKKIRNDVVHNVRQDWPLRDRGD
jgi:hypothetical protein